MNIAGMQSSLSVIGARQIITSEAKGSDPLEEVMIKKEFSIKGLTLNWVFWQKKLSGCKERLQGKQKALFLLVRLLRIELQPI
jgi:hypothetical protein